MRLCRPIRVAARQALRMRMTPLRRLALFLLPLAALATGCLFTSDVEPSTSPSSPATEPMQPEEAESLSISLTDAHNELEAAKKDLAAAQESEADLQGRLAEFRDSSAELREQIKELTEQLIEAMDDKGALNATVVELQNELEADKPDCAGHGNAILGNEADRATMELVAWAIESDCLLDSGDRNVPTLPESTLALYDGQAVIVVGGPAATPDSKLEGINVERRIWGASRLDTMREVIRWAERYSTR